ncbi:MAG: hypothetical protein J6A79_16810 [Clostridia bacterium]|nr:hypothetical protein [Clostridia bacterium]
MNTEKKEAAETPAVTVKMSKLTEGVGILFSGILTMLEALDADTASDLVERFAQKEKVPTAEPLQEETRDEPEDAGSADDVSPDPVADSAAVPEVDQPTAKPVSTVTADDITKIIVRKIKQDRGNNEKIGAILKTYGAAKVSELPEDKYEAFLTDIAAI